MDKSSKRSGFTLIELLASMAVLLVMVVLLGRIFADSTAAWDTGTAAAENNSYGRAVVDLIAKDLSQMVADDVLTMRLYSDIDNVLGKPSDEVWFVTMSNDERYSSGSPYRTAEQIGYFLTPMPDSPNRYRLKRSNVRKWDTGSYQCYDNKQWYNVQRALSSGFYPDIAENVRRFDLWLYDTNGVQVFDYDSDVDGPPLFADVYLELLGEEDAIKVAAIADAGNAGAASDLADKSVKRYAARVYFQNLRGYSE